MNPSPKLVLGPVLRYAGVDGATIWVEVDRPCTVEVLGHGAETFSVLGHHYALVIITGLAAGTRTEYEVQLDGRTVWPPAGDPVGHLPEIELPASIIRIPDPSEEIAVLAGSCRAAAPHEPPYTFERTLDSEARGIDTMWAHASRMATDDPSRWPDLLLLVGDQIYADDSSPGARKRIEALRDDDVDVPPEVVIAYEEYCWLYHEAWSLPTERWLLSTVPSAMIFDDHDMIDDWNISKAWLDDIRHEPWWEQHVVEGMMSYWVYQHLGNLSPDTIAAEGMLAALIAAEDGTDILRTWARRQAGLDDTNGASPYRFSFTRRVGSVTVVVIDCRADRVLEPGSRRMVGSEEWQWIREQALTADGHLVLATSLPVYIADGLHDLHVWNERVCDGAWGRRAAKLGEKVRRALDLEHWSAFGLSYRDMAELLLDLRSAPAPPSSLAVISGDIHFSYVAQVSAPALAVAAGRPTDTHPHARLPIWQIVSSPCRNALVPPERGVLRFTLTGAGARIGAALRRLASGPDTRPSIDLRSGPYFANNMCEVHYRGDSVWVTIEHSEPDADGRPQLQAIDTVELSDGSLSRPEVRQP